MYKIEQITYNGNTRSAVTLYDQQYPNQNYIIAPQLTSEVGQAGSFTFIILPEHPKYNLIKPLETFISATEDGEELFYGRVISVDDPTMTGQISIQCEGALAFLNDGEMAPDPRNSSGSQAGVTQSAEEFFRRCVARYNTEIGNDKRRALTVGTVSHPKKNQVDTYTISSYTPVKQVLESMLVNKHGGFLRIRENQSHEHLIDWIENYGVVDAQPIELAENLIDLTTKFSVDGFYTAIRPIGDNNLTLPEDTIDVYPAADMAKYGKIIKTVTYSDATTQEALRAKANALISRIVKTIYISSEIKFVDMHYIDGTIPKVRVGNVFTNIHKLEGIRMTAAHVEVDFEHPENDNLGLKNAKELEQSDLDGSTAGGGSGKGGRSSSGYSSFKYKFYTETDKEAAIRAEEIKLNADKKFEVTAQNISIVAEGVSENGQALNEIQRSGLWINREHIDAVSGVWNYDEATGNIKLQDGSDLLVKKDGVEISTWGNIRTLNHNVNQVTGSALWTQRDNITGVTGEFQVITDTSTTPPTRRLKIISGGGMTIQRDNVEYGVYDRGTLTGGIIVEKLNDSSVTTHIKGDRIIVGTVDDQTAQTMQNKFGELDGLVAAKATIGQLNAVSARVSTLETDYINATNLAARIADINQVTVKSLLCSGSMVFGQNGTLSIPGSSITFTSGSSPNISTIHPNDFIKAVQIVANGTNGYKLQYKSAFASDSGWTDAGTFSRAVSLSGNWSGTTYSVSATTGVISGTVPSTTVYVEVRGSSTINNKLYAKMYKDSPTDANEIGLVEMTMESIANGTNSYAQVYTMSGATKVPKGQIGTGGIYTSGYNTGWNYGQTRIVRTTRAATSQETTIKTLDYGERFTIVDTYTKSDNTTSEVKYVVAGKAVPSATLAFDCTDLGDPSYDSSAPLKYNDKTVAATASYNSTTIGTGTQVIHLTAGTTWSSGRLPINARMTDDNGKLICRRWINAPSATVSAATSTKPSGTELRSTTVGTGGHKQYHTVNVGGVSRGYITINY